MEFSSRDELLLNSLYPPFAAQVRHFMQYCWRECLPVHLSQAFRLFAEQDDLYKSGKSHAKGGESFHNFALAVDLVFDNSEAPGVQDPYTEPCKGAWEKLANIAVKCGLQPGYFWVSFQDKPHFEAKVESKIETLRSVFLRGGLSGLFAYLDSKEKDSFKLPPSAGTIES